jgi:hypothetical protein
MKYILSRVWISGDRDFADFVLIPITQDLCNGINLGRQVANSDPRISFVGLRLDWSSYYLIARINLPCVIPKGYTEEQAEKESDQLNKLLKELLNEGDYIITEIDYTGDKLELFSIQEYGRLHVYAEDFYLVDIDNEGYVESMGISIDKVLKEFK